jgi:hypothetical protein
LRRVKSSFEGFEALRVWSFDGCGNRVVLAGVESGVEVLELFLDIY